MEKYWIKKELYILNYEFLKFILFFLIFIYLNREKGDLLAACDDVASGPKRRADVARGTSAWMQRGTEATWQGHARRRWR